MKMLRPDSTKRTKSGTSEDAETGQYELNSKISERELKYQPHVDLTDSEESSCRGGEVGYDLKSAGRQLLNNVQNFHKKNTAVMDESEKEFPSHEIRLSNSYVWLLPKPSPPLPPQQKLSLHEKPSYGVGALLNKSYGLCDGIDDEVIHVNHGKEPEPTSVDEISRSPGAEVRYGIIYPAPPPPDMLD